MTANSNNISPGVKESLLAAFVSLQSVFLLTLFCLKHQILSEHAAAAAADRIPRKRFVWQAFKDSLPPSAFRRMFRMTNECFDELCADIEEVVGEEEFKSEAYIERCLKIEKEDYSTASKKRKMFYAHTTTSGGYIAGEVKLAITLRLLSGASYLDIGALYCCGYTYCYEIFHDVIKDWINNDNIEKLKFPGLAYFKDVEAMQKNARAFQTCGTHGGIISGCVGALDGWLVKIRRPGIRGEVVGAIKNYFSRKGYYGVNVQAIVNRDKIVLWRSIKCPGAEHDSTAFKKTNLHGILLSTFRDFLSKGFYLIGDSAYAIRSFILVPFDNAKPQSDEDAFNYHHSTCRIWVECCFGEVDMRWGIV